MSNKNIDSLTDFDGFYKEMQNESPRAAVIIASAFLDSQVRKLLEKFLVDDKKAVEKLIGSEKEIETPLSSFGARISTAYCLGLISKNEYNDLLTIKKIRNKFAHEMHGYTFDDQKIIDWCKDLKLAREITEVDSHINNSHPSLFLLSVFQLTNRLALRILSKKIDHQIPFGNLMTSEVIIRKSADTKI